MKRFQFIQISLIVFCWMSLFCSGKTYAGEILQEQSKSYLQEGVNEQKDGKIEYAITLYQKAIYADPENAQAYNNLGTAYAQQGLYKKAEAAYKKALQIDPIYKIPLMNIALLYGQRGDYDTFFKYWKRAQGLDLYSPFLIDDKIVQD